MISYFKLDDIYFTEDEKIKCTCAVVRETSRGDFDLSGPSGCDVSGVCTSKTGICYANAQLIGPGQVAISQNTCYALTSCLNLSTIALGPKIRNKDNYHTHILCD